MKERWQKTLILLAGFILYGCGGNQDSAPQNAVHQDITVEASERIVAPPVIAPVALPEEMYVYQRLNFRTAPSVSGEIITTLPINTRVSIIERTGAMETIGSERSHWYQISYNGTSGWVFGAWLSRNLNMEHFLLGAWYHSGRHSIASGHRDRAMWRFVDTGGAEFMFFGEDGAFASGISGTGHGSGGTWHAGDFSVVTLDMELRDHDSPRYRWSERWLITVLDQNRMLIYPRIVSRMFPGGSRIFVREDTEIKRIIDSDDVLALQRHLERGNDIDERMLFDLTPLMYAINTGRHATALYLIERGANLDLQDASGRTALHFVTNRAPFFPYALPIAQALVENGIDAAATDEFGQTALDLTIFADRRDFENIDIIHIRRLLTEQGVRASRTAWQNIVNNTVPKLAIFAARRNTSYTTAFSPDGSRIVAGSIDDTNVRVWDIETGQEVSRFAVGQGGAGMVAFCPDGRRIISGSRTIGIRLWDIETGEELRRLEVSPWLSNVRGPVHNRILSVSSTETQLVDVELNQTIRTLDISRPNSWNWELSPDGRRAAALKDGTIWLFDVNTGEQVKAFERRHVRTVAMAFSPDGSQLIASYDNGEIVLWDMETGGEIRMFSSRLSATQFAFIPGTDYVISVGLGGGGITLLNSSTGDISRRFPVRGSSIRSLAVSNDGTHFLTAMLNGTIILWDATWLSNNEPKAIENKDED